MTDHFLLNVARGRVLGHENFEKYGSNPDIDTTTDPEDVWNGDGDYPGFPTGDAETMEIASNSGNDDATGTGAQTVLITNLLDADGAVAEDVTVTLDGTNQVSLGALTYTRASRVKVLTVGSGGANAGVLTLRHTTTTANIFAAMPVGANQTAIAAYTVPLGKTLYINRLNIQMSRVNGQAGSATVSLRSRPYGEVFQVIVVPEISNGGPFIFENGYRVFTERTDIKVRCEQVSDNNTSISADMSGILVDN